MTMIGTNVAALRAQAGSRTAQTQLQTAMERLSTGQRINSAKDDAAGLAISSRMTSQIRGLAVAVRNASDGISMTQTAEGALGEVTNMLQRVKELAVQSANATLGTSERSALQAETNQLVEQINDISKTTNFNGLKLLDGSVKSLNLQTGVNSGDTIAVNLTSMSADDLGLTTGTGGVVSGRVGDGGPVAPNSVTLNGVAAFAGTANVSWNNAKELASLVNGNSSRTGITATAFNSVTTSAAFTGAVVGGTINGKAVGSAATAAEFVDLVNRNSAEYGVTASLGTDNKISFANKTGEAISTTGFSTIASTDGYVSLKSSDGKNFTVGGTLTNTGLTEYNGAGYVGAALTDASAVTDGQLTINGVNIGAIADAGTAAQNATAFAAAINAKSAETGVSASVLDDANDNRLILSSNSGGAVKIGGTNPTAAGFSAQGADGVSFDLDISSQNAASAALSVIDKALDTVSAKRGDLGAIQNRLEVTVNSLNTQSTNLTDARSRIQDADFSTETTNLAKAQILGQAATAMLAQANQSQQNVLSLLR
ncbi:flagellin [Sphingomonas jejuensis]|uniref:Flagellin n=1 Tax=Sphingomonas jejuensis TaxID=904715 RepID=A0ABX0XMX4_9SPHN|nr:flagellin [Sphingomonas jejuensis]